MSDKQCGNCTFGRNKLEIEKSADLVCYLNPPVLIHLTLGYAGDSEDWGRPPVKSHQICGSWSNEQE